MKRARYEREIPATGPFAEAMKAIADLQEHAPDDARSLMVLAGFDGDFALIVARANTRTCSAQQLSDAIGKQLTKMVDQDDAE